MPTAPLTVTQTARWPWTGRGGLGGHTRLAPARLPPPGALAADTSELPFPLPRSGDTGHRHRVSRGGCMNKCPFRAGGAGWSPAHEEARSVPDAQRVSLCDPPARGGGSGPRPAWGRPFGVCDFFPFQFPAEPNETLGPFTKPTSSLNSLKLPAKMFVASTNRGPRNTQQRLTGGRKQLAGRQVT